MSIASPRASISSRRTSTSTDATGHAPPVERGTLRRNRDRTALRDYYGIKAAGGASSQETLPAPSLAAERECELDRPDFDATTYVNSLLAKESLQGVLKVEAALLSETRSLDGEKKALVYDNYSKLIAATDTIRNMRERMDPMTPTTSTLTPAIGHIAETASVLSTEMRNSHGSVKSDADRKRRDQQEGVQWVLAAPSRLRSLREEGRSEEAQTQWEQISMLLNNWSGVRGVKEVRQSCQLVMEAAEGEG